MTDETPKTHRKHAIAALPTSIAIEIRRRICGSRRFMRVLGNMEPGVTRRSLVNSLAAFYGVPRAAVYRLCNAIELAALADAHDRAALAMAQQMREANEGRADFPWAERRKEMDERPRKTHKRQAAEK
jgi:hypothetical protein